MDTEDRNPASCDDVDLCGFHNTTFKVPPVLAMQKNPLYSLGVVDEGQEVLLNSFNSQLPTFFYSKSAFSRFVLHDLKKCVNVQLKKSFDDSLVYYKRFHPDTITQMVFYLLPGYDPIFEDSVFAYGVPYGNLSIIDHTVSQKGAFFTKCLDGLVFGHELPDVPLRVLMCRAVCTPPKVVESLDAWPRDQKPSDQMKNLIVFRPQGYGNSAMRYLKNMAFFQDRREVVRVEEKAAERLRCVMPYMVITCSFRPGTKPIPPFTIPGQNVANTRLVDVNYDGKILPSRLFPRFEHNEGVKEIECHGVHIDLLAKHSNVDTDILLRFVSIFLKSPGVSFAIFDTICVNAPETGVRFRSKHAMLYPEDNPMSNMPFTNLRDLIKKMGREQLVGICAVSSIKDTFQNDHEWMEKGALNLVMPSCLFTTMIGVPFFEADVLHYISLREYQHSENHAEEIKMTSSDDDIVVLD